MTNPNEKQIGGDHYQTSGLQHWDVCAIGRVGWLEGSATKYLSRWKNKNGVEDLRKAQHCVEKLIHCIEEYDLQPGNDLDLELVNAFMGKDQFGKLEELAMRLLFSWTRVSDVIAVALLVNILIEQEEEDAEK